MTPASKLSSSTVEVIADPPICNVVAFTSPEAPYITALLLTTVPAEEPSSKLSSVAVEVTPSKILSSLVVAVTPSSKLSSSAVVVTNVPASLRPPSTASCDAISIV